MEYRCKYCQQVKIAKTGKKPTFCSRACFARYKQEACLVYRLCSRPECRAAFSQRQGDRPKLFCCDTCARIAQKPSLVTTERRQAVAEGRKRSPNVGHKIRYECDWCGGEIWDYECARGRYNTHFCNRKCYLAYLGKWGRNKVGVETADVERPCRRGEANTRVYLVGEKGNRELVNGPL